MTRPLRVFLVLVALTITATTAGALLAPVRHPH